LSRNNGVARAVALAQTGQKSLAEDVLLRAHGKLDRGLDTAFGALAADMGFQGALVYVASRSADPRGAYPILPVQPNGGFQVDSALIHAIVRQESRFDPMAVSSAGARGLMQVLPSTAKLGEDPNGRLFDPVYNLTVGQNYVREMMRFSSPDGNLLQTAVAYNGGPGNLQKWRANVDYGDDPLLFIESLPNRETRGYVERVMANFWIYQMRMGKPTPTLDQLASGKWPIYGGAAARSASLQ
jgi:soluble lytic murein transglycosylase-like protein